MTTTENTFARVIEGSCGTVVFGNGVPAVTGEVTEVGDDYFILDDHGTIHSIPTANVAYYRFAEEA